nr:thiocillin/thiostrepton family thiazolyl peptide [Macrococcus caseolyticus]
MKLRDISDKFKEGIIIYAFKEVEKMSEFQTNNIEGLDVTDLEFISEEVTEKDEKEIMGASCTTCVCTCSCCTT